MKIAIVGSSKLNEIEEKTANEYCGMIFDSLIKEHGTNDLIFVSGGAKGVDTVAENKAKELGIKCQIHLPTEPGWDAYKVRNIKIAEDCDLLYCLPTKLKLEPCYHCDSKDHERSGACWTMKEAKRLKKETHLVPLI